MRDTLSGTSATTWSLRTWSVARWPRGRSERVVRAVGAIPGGAVHGGKRLWPAPRPAPPASPRPTARCVRGAGTPGQSHSPARVLIAATAGCRVCECVCVCARQSGSGVAESRRGTGSQAASHTDYHSLLLPPSRHQLTRDYTGIHGPSPGLCAPGLHVCGSDPPSVVLDMAAKCMESGSPGLGLQTHRD